MIRSHAGPLPSVVKRVRALCVFGAAILSCGGLWASGGNAETAETPPHEKWFAAGITHWTEDVHQPGLDQ